MQLSYRGVPYQASTSTIEITETGLGGKYRGIDFRFWGSKESLIPRAALRLKYRGVDHLSFRL